MTVDARPPLAEGSPRPSSGVEDRVRTRSLVDRLRHRYTPAERRRLVAALFPAERWIFRFGFMMAMSVVIVVQGLTANSVAAVIGAMLIAPLMTPVMGFAAALAMRWPRRAIRCALTVLLASVGAVALAGFLAMFQRTQPLTSEVLLRTSPDGRDFLLALAAGAAGAYATAREDVSVALPGVAIAVALVPPLGTLGIVIEAGRMDLAGGVVLLYVANLVAIVLAGIVTFVVTGFVPITRLLGESARYLRTFVLALAAVIAVGIPLTFRSIDAAADARDIEQVNRAVTGWIDGRDLEIDRIRRDGDDVILDLVGPDQPPDQQQLVADLRRILGEQAGVEVRWLQTSSVAVVEELAPDPAATREAIAARVAPLVGAWIDGPGKDLEVSTVDVRADDGSDIELTVVGADQPPPVGPLAEAISAELARSVDLRVRWIERPVFDPTTDPDPSVAERREEVADVVDAYVAGDAALDVLSLSVDVSDRVVVVDLVGAVAPDDPDRLRSQIRSVLGPETSVEIRFVPRFELTE